MINNKNNIPDGFHNAVLDAFKEIDSMSSNKPNHKNRILKITAGAAVSNQLLISV